MSAVRHDLVTRGPSHRSLRDVGGADAVVVEGLTKRYGGRAAVDDLSFAIPTGTVTGLIGPNGAGKTTLMAMLLGLVRPTSGTGSVLGEPLGKTAGYLDRVGALIESPAFHPAVSGIDNLRSLAVLGGRSQRTIPDLIELVGLAGRGQDRVGSYSTGMKQRLGIAASLLGDPELILLDEPTNGLDPVGMQDVRRLIGEIALGGRTILVSSHLLGELEQVADWLIVIDHGGLVHLGTPESLAAAGEALVLRTADPAQTPMLRTMVDDSTPIGVEVDGDDVLVMLDGDVDAASLAVEINRRAHTAGIVLSELHYRRADLEARYLNLVSQGATS
ncbi:MAG: ABC transporter ATP-binding protein [Acidimicrobiales bacterium]